MHTLTLIPGLAVFLSMTVTAQVCGNNIFPVGYQCGPNMKNGDRSCDPSCSNILVCNNGKMQINNPCSPGRCVWREDAGSAYCSGGLAAVEGVPPTDFSRQHPISMEYSEAEDD